MNFSLFFHYSFVRVGRFRFSTWPQEAFWRRLMPMMELFGPCVSLQTRYNIDLSFEWQRASHPYKTPVCDSSEFLTLFQRQRVSCQQGFLLYVSIFDFDLCVLMQRGIVTGGADKTVKFWDFELIKDEDSGKNKWVIICHHKPRLSNPDFSISLSLLGFNVLLLCVIHRRLTVKHTRTLQLDEDVLCVRYSPDQRLLAVSLLDCTVKIFYTDTLKVNHMHSV